MSEYAVGQVIEDREEALKLPVGSIISWYDEDEEEIGIIRNWSGEICVDNTACYYAHETYIIAGPFTIERLGSGEDQLCFGCGGDKRIGGHGYGGGYGGCV